MRRSWTFPVEELVSAGPIIECDVTATGVRAGTKVVRVRMLIDTGAEVSAIPYALATAADLPAIRSCSIEGVVARTRVEVPLYYARLVLPLLSPLAITANFLGAELDGRGGSALGLIGRNVLKAFRLTYSGRGEVTLEKL